KALFWLLPLLLLLAHDLTIASNAFLDLVLSSPAAAEQQQQQQQQQQQWQQTETTFCA
ncbi:hypothetical protein AWZ03_008389, partial [Drosophila navojoa]